MKLVMGRSWAMPSHDTMKVAPIGGFAKRYLMASRRSVDPFARNSRLASVTNDLNPETAAQYHMDAEAFCRMLAERGDTFDLAIFDPPYSPRQVSECYQSVGLEVGMKDTQTAVLYQRVRNALDAIMQPDGIVLSFGWNSAGMGEGRNYQLVEVLLVAHGGAHNDTICIAERKIMEPDLFEVAT